jgi:hypothetical protein
VEKLRMENESIRKEMKDQKTCLEKLNVRSDEVKQLNSKDLIIKAYSFEKPQKRVIEVQNICKVNPKELVLEPIIRKEGNASFKMMKNPETSELDDLLDQDEPKIVMPTNIKEFKREADDEEIMEEKCCHV